MSFKAITHIRRLRGGSQAQLMVADDGHEYVIKFQGNPQTTRVLANEYLAARLARMIKLNVPSPPSSTSMPRPFADTTFHFSSLEVK